MVFTNKALGVLGVGDVTTVVADVPATVIATKSWVEEAWVYIRNKMATIFFQNILRKVVNNFAQDAAKYVGSGGKGQEALYIKEKWGNFWQNVGDKAAGDFIERFANSVISDVAYDDIMAEGQAKCDKIKDECLKTKSVEDCNKKHIDCLVNRDANSDCKKAYNQCTAQCNNNEQSCVEQCASIFSGCNDGAGGGSLTNKRVAPMIGKGSPLAKINICNPSLAASIQMGFGLVQYNTGYNPDCSFSKMVKNWKTEADRVRDMAKPDYLKKMASQFQPNSNELYVAFTLQTNLIEYRGKQQNISEKETIANKGWLDVRNIAGDSLGTPGEAEERKKLVEQGLWNNLGKVSGDILVDAANIFLNQLAITGWQNLMGSLSETNSSANLSSANWSGQSTNRQAIENKISQMKEPTFAEPGKLDILRDLTSCNSVQNPGPTNCVITSRFGEAITSKMTVIEAVKAGYLPGDLPFGFNKFGEDKLEYNQGYPYRSLMILRKYRILPVGWEVAAQDIQKNYINDNSTEKVSEKVLSVGRPNGVSLNDLLSCYSKDDDINNGYYENWCEGLIDPYWVLMLPDYYCGAKGYGAYLSQDPTLANSGIKYCSNDKGDQAVKVDEEYRQCNVDNDCCNKEEAALKETYLAKGDTKHYKEPCALSCTYQEKKLMVDRDNSYCADEKSCIKYDKTGNCLTYGYCTQEKRTWSFNRENQDKSCEPYANTCQSFENDKGVASYFLANTLDYASCDANNIGCKKYATTGVYDEAKNKMAWNDTKIINFDKDAQSCKESEEGCHEFIRAGFNYGTNLVGDGDFEGGDVNRWSNYGTLVTKETANAKVYTGNNSLHVGAGQKGVYYSSDDKTLLPAGFEFEVDQAYVASALVYVVSGEVEISMGNKNKADSWQTLYSTTNNEWEEFVLQVNNDVATNVDTFKITASGGAAEFYVDNLKFEFGNDPSKFSVYGGSNLAYLKMMPKYLEKVCYNDFTKGDYDLKPSAPEICNKFVRRCQKDEVGCQLYIDQETQDQTAAQTKANDYCPKECVGYDTFIQKSNHFFDEREDSFIPKTAKTCSAQAVGCALFVNLDKVKEGGESEEYLSSVRHCTTKNATCGTFYSWEGSQLMAYELQANQTTKDSLSQPATVDDNDQSDNSDGDFCNEYIFGLPAGHPNYNSDCRQFVGRDGKISYHLMDSTIECSDNCHPYRLVKKNIDYSIDNSTDCSGSNKHWDDTNKECSVCKSGGEWNSEQNACVYYNIPGRGKACSADMAGCSEYSGNFGKKVKFILNDNFESGLADWQTAKLSTESLRKGGSSVMPSDSDGISKNIAGKIKAGKKYVLSFLAKSKNGVEIKNIYFSKDSQSSTSVLSLVKGVKTSADWQQYRFSMTPDSETDMNYINFIFSEMGDSGIYVDDIRLNEYDDRYFLVRDSWKTPAVCDEDSQGNPFPLYALGCRAYKTGNGDNAYLKSFSSLCQFSGVGCELMIDTFNSNYYGAEYYSVKGAGSLKVASCDKNDKECITIPADQITYVVYDNNKTCYSQKKGCDRLGLSSSETSLYSDIYMINNPDYYASILCKTANVGCSAWIKSDNSQTYFKDPGNNVCEYRQSGTSGNYSWFKKKASHCFAVDSASSCSNDNYCVTQYGAGFSCQADNSGNQRCASISSCKSTVDCNNAQECLLNNIDVACVTSAHKTVGSGVRSQKLQPVGMIANGYAGACSQSQDNCTEYIDPKSMLSYNMLSAYDASGKDYELLPDTLYILKATDNGSGSVRINCSTPALHYIDKDNNINQAGVNYLDVEIKNSKGYSEEFYIDSAEAASRINSDTGRVSCRVTGQATELKEALVAYKIKDSLYAEVPTTVSLEKGGVLFNERVWTGSGYKSLTYDTNSSSEGGAPSPAASTPPGNNANRLLKVDPGRQCGQWLGCKSYGINPTNKGEKICYERGLCDQLNETGECIHFIQPSDKELTYNPDSAERKTFLSYISNMSGYSKAGYIGNMLSADLYHFANMNEVGETKINFDGSFENSFDTGFWPAGSDNNRQNSYIRTLRDAAVIQQELGTAGYRNLPAGVSVGKSSGCVVKEINNITGNDYIVSANVFTRFGDKTELSVIGDNDNGCKILSEDKNPKCDVGDKTSLVASSKIVGSWVNLTGRFKLAGDYTKGGKRADKIKIQICSKGSFYFDDVKVEPGLKVRSDKYIHPICRLYPEGSANSCEYYDDAGMRKKGWTGYCMEYDPRNTNVCLLWYPIDKVASEEFEEGAALEIPKDLYYCIDAEDQCSASNPIEPEFYCKTFVKVDKTKYWYSRINAGSSYAIPQSLLSVGRASSVVDFGIDSDNKAGGVVPITINQGIGSGYYGALSLKSGLAYSKETMGISGLKTNKKLYPFVPYYGISYGGKLLNDPSRKNLCKATIDSERRDNPIVLGNGGGSGSDEDATIYSYDDCFVKMISQNVSNDCESGLNTCCNWNAEKGECQDELAHPKPCGGGGNDGYQCAQKTCAEGDSSSSCTNGGGFNGTGDYTWNFSPYNNIYYSSMWKRFSDSGNVPDVRCNVWKNKNNTGQFFIKNTDTGNDGDSTVCLFDCYNHTNKYEIADDSTRAVYAINRLFNAVEGCYEWNDSSNRYETCSSYNENIVSGTGGIRTPSTQCANNQRQNFSNSNYNADFCYVKPVVGDIKTNLPIQNNWYVL
ncbi:MAG: hypothetical protein PHR00_04465, partial [Patescibacteria group bacterium]|nr:hypothetical protein [Patescibacteria group bacterium]